MSHFNLRPYQQEALSSIPERGSFLICMATGLGKCFRKGTPVLMYDGSIKPVENIHEGELVMGHDSQPRRVTGLAHGHDQMYTITPAKGMPYTVNSEHILSLKISGGKGRVSDSLGRKFKTDDVCNISVVDYLRCSNTFKHRAKGWRTGVSFCSQEITIPPYVLGLWLADGHSRTTAITTMDTEIVEAMNDYCTANNLIMRPAKYQNSGKAITYLINGNYNNVFLSALRGYDLLQNKHIPQQYLVNSRTTRLELLAGLIDGDGYLMDNTFEIATSKIVMREGILFLARSLGFASYSSDKVIQGKTYYRIFISGDIHLIPVRVSRRKPTARRQVKNVLHTGIKVEPAGEDEYFGFELEGIDRMFLLGDFTVVHNTVTFSQIPRKGRMLILSHREELVYQPRKYFDCSYGVEMSSQTSHGEEVVSASVQSLVRRLDRFKPDDFDVLITDEAHHAVSPTYRKIYNYFKPRLHLGFTATPNRNDGVGLKAIYSDIIYHRDIQWGIENGYLSNIKCLRVQLDMDLSNVTERMGDYTVDSLDDAVNIQSANEGIAEAYEKYAVPPCLIFCVSVAHAENLAELIPNAVSVKGGEDRSDKVQGFLEGRIPCITNCMVFTEGTDLPNVNSIIIARPTKNVSLYTQMVGRGLRLYPDKPYLTLIDCVDVTSRANICTAPSLLGISINEVPKKAREKIQGDLFDLPAIVEQVIDTPASWVKNVEIVELFARKNKYDLHGINFFRMPDGRMVLSKPKLILPPEDSLGRIMWLGKPEPAQKVFDEVYRGLMIKYKEIRPLWDVNIAKRWGSAPASDKQKAVIAKRFPEVDISNITKLQAGQILTRCFTK